MTTVNPYAAAARVAEDIKATGGSTRSIVPGVRTPDSGYAVSLPDHEQRYELVSDGTERDTFVRLVTTLYAERHQHTLARPGHYLGAWLDGNTLYLDVSQVVHERATAERLGRERGQLAVYDLATGEDIKLTEEVAA